MQKYQKTYIKALGLNVKDSDVLAMLKSEISGLQAHDIHHIKYMMTGVERQDYPFERLIALTRDEHTKFGDKKQYFDYLLWVHYFKVQEHYKEFDIKYFPNSIFDWEGNTPAHDSLFEFYEKCLERGYYVEVWEMPDQCSISVFNSIGNKIKEFSKRTKFEIFERTVNLPKPVSWK